MAEQGSGPVESTPPTSKGHAQAYLSDLKKVPGDLLQHAKDLRDTFRSKGEQDPYKEKFKQAEKIAQTVTSAPEDDPQRAKRAERAADMLNAVADSPEELIAVRERLKALKDTE